MRNNINLNSVNKLAHNIKSSYKSLDIHGFVDEIVPYLEPLGLFERLNLVTRTLYKYLPENYEEAVKIILDSAKNERGFIALSLSNYIADYGLDYLDISMNALVILTKNFSSEFAIRPFLIKYPKECLTYLREWVNNESVDVRRLVSEGTRPRLPWGIKLDLYVKDPLPLFEFLEILKDDKELYVRKSVANNLNDISKDNAELLLDKLQTWSDTKSDRVKWVIKHGLRTLIKKGDPTALKILGYKSDTKLSVKNIAFSSKVTLGEYLYFSFDIQSETSKDQNLVIDYVVFYKKANGSNAPKVYKLKNVVLKGNDKIFITKKQHFKEISTRKYYLGEHLLYIKINGKEYYCGKFDLQV